MSHLKPVSLGVDAIAGSRKNMKPSSNLELTGPMSLPELVSMVPISGLAFRQLKDWVLNDISQELIGSSVGVPRADAVPATSLGQGGLLGVETTLSKLFTNTGDSVFNPRTTKTARKSNPHLGASRERKPTTATSCISAQA